MALIISDANIFIDMAVGGLTRLLFRIGEEVAVPDVLYEEELREHHGDLPGFGLRILEVEERFVTEAIRMAEDYPKTSLNDRLALALAMQKKCPLLTGDAFLRQAAEAERLDVKGTVWLMERFWAHGLVTYQRVEIAYAAMRDENRRLPWNEIEAQLRKFNDQ